MEVATPGPKEPVAQILGDVPIEPIALEGPEPTLLPKHRLYGSPFAAAPEGFPLSGYTGGIAG